MLTTKNQDARIRVALVVACAAGFLTACGPAGPRALLEGERLIREGQYAKAIPKLERATTLLPQNAQAWNHLGLAYHAAGQLEAAAQAYRQALIVDRQLSAPRFNLGCLALERGDPEGAARELTTYLTFEPTSESAWLKLGTAQLRLRQTDAAERSFRKGLQLDPRSAEACNGLGLVQVQRRRYPEAYQQFNAATELERDYAPALLNAAIVAHQFLNNRALALQKYRAVQALPSVPQAQAVAQIVAQLEDEIRPVPAPKPPPAAAAAGQATSPTSGTSPAVSPSAPRPGPLAARGGGGTSLATRSPGTNEGSRARLPTAAPAAARTPNLPPPPAPTTTSAPAPLATASAPAELTRTTAAPPSVAAAPPQSPPGGPARYRYGAIGTLRAGDRAEAERLVHEGGVAYERNRLSEALALYRQAAQADPTCFDAHYNLGVTAYEGGDLGQALSAYESALALESESLKARFNFAATLERAGYARDAALELERLVPRHPAETRIHLRLGNLYARKLGEPDRANRHYRKVLELEPQHPDASAIRFWLEANP